MKKVLMKKQINAFGLKIHPLKLQEFVDIICHGIETDKKIVQSGINVASIVELDKTAELIEAYNNCDLINVDGMSLVWALRFFGHTIPERVACPDLAQALLELAEKNNYTLFLFGAIEEHLHSAIGNIKSNYPHLQIVGHRNGYFTPEEEQNIVDLINQSGSDILFLGLPTPKKELFVEKYKAQLNVKYILGVGGFFDILAGSIRRAPVWMQNIGLEWLYRFIQEPQRLLNRYFIGSIRFFRIVLVEKKKLKIKKRENL